MTEFLRLPATLDARPPWVRDTAAACAAIVLVLAVRTAFGLFTGGGAFPGSWSLFLLANLPTVADLATIAVRRRAPCLALGLATAVVLASSALPISFTGTGVGVLVCAYSVGTMLPRHGVAVSLVAFGLLHALGGVLAADRGGDLSTLLTFLGHDGAAPINLVLASLSAYGLPGLLGLYVQARRRHTADLASRLERADAERERRAWEAVAQERRRIARELHDVAAHHLSAIVVQAGATDRLVERDPASARESLRAIRAQGRETLTSLRGLVGIMRAHGRHETDDPEGLAPQPTVSRLADLIASARQAGTTVEFTVEGEPVPLATVVDLAAYRLVQEALTNARRHAPGAPVTVLLGYSPAELRIMVRNGAGAEPAVLPSAGDGHGLAGMRERVAHAGGSLTAGPTAAGEWRIDARLPLGDSQG
ncbi:signal transduction histidine kinase [Actinoalloteichus hoggarensis]|uniref:histidine kinase n=1 Tax=Actinoalloteichus hoggarensis TaxID=1470176 RepID=A0A221W9H3_9PSEU|nr:histidine kinase [Actinoalloteichus hoggarensis]ASO21987.1 Sensor histidine kinase LiaS [Actinoalloteichus hoggarensis]MBB5923933.1 signal transduction histidine kinase [Actinoalloteichus hoggarensis]